MGLDFSDISKLEEIIRHQRHGSGSLISILQDIQSEYNYLSREMLVLICERLGLPLSQVYSVVTFFKEFSLKPKGKYDVRLCLGTACHVRGSQRILEEIERELGIKIGETTPDMIFSIYEVRCLGCCGLAPVMMVKEDVHGKLSLEKMHLILKGYRERVEEDAKDKD